MDVELLRRAERHRALAEPHRLAIVDALAGSDRTPGELGALVGAPANLLAHHLGVLEASGVVQRRVSSGDGRRRYVRLDPEALADLLPGADRPRPERPLFVCTQNAARSQFAAGLWRRLRGTQAGSAGSRPAARVHPQAVEAAARRGVDLTGARPRGYDEVEGTPDLVVSVCDRALERGLPFDLPQVHWSVPDPVGGNAASFDSAFDDIARRVVDLAGVSETRS